MVHPKCIGYEVILSDEAKRFLKKLDSKIVSRILAKLKDLTSEKCENLDIKKLKENKSLYRIRVGDYRIIYSINNREIIVFVVKIGHRKDVYE